MFRRLIQSCVSSRFGLATVCLLGVIGQPAAASIASTASAVISYNSGTPTPLFDSTYVYGSSSWTSGPALGLPATTVGGYYNGYYNDYSVITPFNAQYNPADFVGISGAGGSIEFQLSQSIATNGFTLSVQSGIGLYDATGNGDNLPTAAYYNNPQNATVFVSQDGTHWVSLGDTSFTIPTNVYTDVSGPYTNTPGTILADFAKPFTGTLASFNGESFQQTLATLNGSGGGTWFDLSGTGLSEVNYVMLETDADNMSDEADETMYVNEITGIAVPEPGSGMLIIGLLSIGAMRRRRK